VEVLGVWVARSTEKDLEWGGILEEPQMTDPVTAMTAGAIASLAFQEFVKSGVGELVKRFTGEAIARMGELRQKIVEKLQGKSKAETAIAAVEQGSKIDLDRLAVYLQDEMEDDPQFADDVRILANEINAGKLIDNSSMTQNNYDNAKGWQTKVEGGVAYIGEIHISEKRPES
jgi:hypothetical protein